MKKILLLFIIAVGFSCSDDEIIDYTAQNEADIQAYLAANNINAQKTLSGLYYVINEEGNGESPIFNSNVTLGYKGYFLDGTTFDSSSKATFNVNQVVPGFAEAVTILKIGGSGTFILPSRLGYGNRGSRSIAPGDVIVFDINLISIN
ncbi:FKBP-type peptidyl-prolyl cis-trans isomerase [Polaribacter sp. Hel_I_88]|uniref:FKBP-type peptidyl-prolyl cis-trans isomerase n=1 Tax=Polaribacter sp. Hel_I_88 TaxID=1250006 RepID=UPI00047B78F5|nr:FKBP-type peptidyl-prolyl cis-trans isomerase [Polaribacter sp. Hel_I_88]